MILGAIKEYNASNERLIRRIIRNVDDRALQRINDLDSTDATKAQEDQQGICGPLTRAVVDQANIEYEDVVDKEGYSYLEVPVIDLTG